MNFLFHSLPSILYICSVVELRSNSHDTLSREFNNSISSYSACLKGESFSTQSSTTIITNVCAYSVDMHLSVERVSHHLRHG